MIVNVTSPAWLTTKLPVNEAKKLPSGPLPAWKPLPWATIRPLKLPLTSTVLSVNGRVAGPTDEMSCGTTEGSELNRMSGNDWPNTGVPAAAKAQLLLGLG